MSLNIITPCGRGGGHYSRFF